MMQVERVVIGVSPFNSLFSAECLHAALRWGRQKWERCVKQMRQDFKRINAALCETGIALESGSVLCIDQFLEEDGWYRALRQLVVEEFQENECFQDACLTMSAKATASRCRAVGVDTPPDLTEAVKYIFDETPAYTHCSRLVGGEKVALAYPRPWPVGEMIDAGGTKLAKDGKSTFRIIESLMET